MAGISLEARRASRKRLREREVVCAEHIWNYRDCTIAHALFNGRLSHDPRRPITLLGNAARPSLGSSAREAAILRSVAYRTDATRGVEYDPRLTTLPSGSRRSEARPHTLAPHLCRACKTRLFLIRRHTSPPRLGAPLVTEFYRCDGCDSGYAFSPATGRWKPWQLED